MKKEIEKFCPKLSPNDFVALYGSLGAGKTFTVQTICRFFNVTERVTSPSFNFVNFYEGDIGIYHVDLYRLKNYGELSFLAWDDIIGSDALKLVEWADRLETDYLPYPRWDIFLRIAEGGGREAAIRRVRKK